MMPLSRYRIPKIARRAAFGHMNDYDLEIRSCGWVRSSFGCTKLRPRLCTMCIEEYSMAMFALRGFPRVEQKAFMEADAKVAMSEYELLKKRFMQTESD
jgi:hypothetical protein